MTAEYSMRPDGRITVLNRGYDAKSGRWKEAQGVAQLRGAAGVGSLGVSFFWLFWARYHVIDLDHECYQYALILQCLPLRRQVFETEGYRFESCRA